MCPPGVTDDTAEIRTRNQGRSTDGNGARLLQRGVVRSKRGGDRTGASETHEAVLRVHDEDSSEIARKCSDPPEVAAIAPVGEDDQQRIRGRAPYPFLPQEPLRAVEPMRKRGAAACRNCRYEGTCRGEPGRRRDEQLRTLVAEHLYSDRIAVLRSLVEDIEERRFRLGHALACAHRAAPIDEHQHEAPRGDLSAMDADVLGPHRMTLAAKERGDDGR